MADRELSIDNLDAAQGAMKDCPEELRGWEWHYLNRLCKVDPRFIRDSTEVNSVAFSPDGESIATAGGDGAIKIWNSRTCQRNRILNPAHTDSVLGVFFHPHGRHLASVGPIDGSGSGT